MIRPYAETDLDRVLDIWYRASLIAHSFLSDEFFVRERQQIADEWIPVAETSVYEGDDGVAGFLSLVGNEVGAIFVDPDRQRSGIGRALMDHARASRPFLELDVFEDNQLGRGFYAAYGFTLRSRGVHEATGQPLLHLRLD